MSKVRNAKNKFSFDDDEDQSKPITPVKIRQSSMKKSSKKQYKFDFNDNSQEDINPIIKKATLEVNTHDTLGNISSNCNKNQNNMSNQQPNNIFPDGVLFKDNNSEIQSSIFQEQSKPEDNSKVIFKGFNQELKKQGKYNQSKLTRSAANNFVHIEEIQYIQNLASNIFNNLFEDLSLNILDGKWSKKISSNNSFFVKKQSKSFISLIEILNKKRSDGENIRKELKVWSIYNLKEINRDDCLVEKGHKNYKLMMFAQDRLHDLIQELIHQVEYDEALTIANIHDIASYKQLQSKNSNFRYCYTIIQAENIKTMPKICWLVDLALAINYFKSLELQQIINQIYKKYENTLIKQLPSAFLSILLAFCNDKPIITEPFINKLIHNELRLEYLHQIFIIYTLNKQPNLYQQSFKQLKTTLIKKFKSTKLFLDFIIYLNIKNAQEFRELIGLHIDNESSKESKAVRTQKLYQEIKQYEIDEVELPIQIIQLRRWLKFKEFQKKCLKLQFHEALEYYIYYIHQIQANVIFEKTEMDKVMMTTLTRYEFLCNFRQIQKKKSLQIMYSLQKSLKGQSQVMKILRGCIAFMQMKLNIFNLLQKQKIQCLWALHLYLQDSENHQNQLKIKANIQRTLQTLLKTNDGRIYLANQLKGFCLNTTLRERYLNLISRKIEYQKDDQGLKESRISKILEILGDNNEIQRFILIELTFY